jgi:hypothetical protein
MEEEEGESSGPPPEGIEEGKGEFIHSERENSTFGSRTFHQEIKSLLLCFKKAFRSKSRERIFFQIVET